ncbi:monocarboxylate transporter 12-like isoform X3 [Mercenaria mercenaria]|uniref:monocarboxylate transporter 12-like isoform X3 n=1 Tax=Mercenaria mercenaria TaxID=6596 RepID=UPI00234F7F65|nr:monocarboxylate transporter 12-like isoform X3 [Mercenaria mercenaria]
MIEQVAASCASSTMNDPTEDGSRWVIVLGSFFVQFIVCGITYSLGIFQVVFQDVFSEDHFDTSWAGSILLYVTALTSVVFRCFMSKFGSRVCVMLGGLIAAGGLALSVFVNDVFQLYLTYGLMTGVGFGLACTPSIMIIEQHFHRRRFMAISLAVGGVGMGIIAFPFVIKHLLEYYAWRGTLLILAGFAFNLCVCGAVMFPVHKSKEVRLLPLLSCVPLRNPIFHGLCISNFFWSFGSTIVYMYLPAYAIYEHTDLENSFLLVACIGIASFTSRSIFAFMGRKSALDDVTAVLCSVTLGVVLTGVSPMLFEKYAGQIAFTLIFGFYSGYWTTFLSQISRELVGPEYIAMGNGYLSFMIAVGSLLGGPCAGILIREKEEFRYAFYMAGASLIWSNVILLLFKFKRCGPLPSTEGARGPSKAPLLDDVYVPVKVMTSKGDQVLVVQMNN